MDEFSWIDALKKALGDLPQSPFGIGDDAAVLPLLAKGRVRVIASDLMAEGVHFRADWSRLEDVAFKLYASNASDMWAMGAAPQSWLFSLATAHAPNEDEVQAIAMGFLQAQEQWGKAPLIGGDSSRSLGGRFFSVTMLGERDDTAWTRDAFVPGDRVWVDGPLGWSGAGLAMLQAGSADRSHPAMLQHLRPQRQAADYGFAARGAIDISDGLSADLWHAAQASGVSIVIDAPLPGETLLQEVADNLGIAKARQKETLRSWQCAGGEDYVRAVGFSKCPGAGWFPIASIESGPAGVWIIEDGLRKPLPSAGWNHFSSSENS